MTETEHRFLKAIADRIAPERVAEVRLFPAMKQGHMQSAVAVVAAEATPELAPDANAEAANVAVEPLDDVRGPDPASAAPAAVTTTTPRLSVLTARYRLTLKGPERGKWEFELLHDADAPLDAVERVVQGVVRRAGDTADPELLSAADFRRAVSEQWWSGDTAR